MPDDPLAVHRFADPLPLDAGAARRWLGGKGASVAEMTAMELPVPPGFTLGTGLWRHWDAEGRLPDGLRACLEAELAEVEAATGRRFGDASAPLLLAVRSGGPSSMPGMLDTVLDVGVDAPIARGLADALEGTARFALDVRRRFLEHWGTTVLGIPLEAFTALAGPGGAHTLDEPGLEALVVEYERAIRREAGVPVPDDPWAQLLGAIEGVLQSWRSERARAYRAAHGIAHDEGTGVTVQAMVYGNLGQRSGAGVVFTRNPSTGAPALFGEWLPEAQGEDVVGGRRTPRPLTRGQVRRGREDDSFETAEPEVYTRIAQICARLEDRYLDVQDVEFTVERGALWILQSRPATRSARAAARIAVEMVEEGRIDRRDALRRVDPASLRQLITPRLPDPEDLSRAGTDPLARGLAASPGAASGRIVLDADAPVAEGDDRILVRAETSAEDVEAMRASAGILTAAGGLTSHAAVVARAMGKPCVAGVSGLHVDYPRRVVVARGAAGSVELVEGDTITIDGGRGLVYAGEVPVEPAPVSPHVEQILAWARARCPVRVFAEVHREPQARAGVSFGADGIVAAAPRASTLDVLRDAVGEGLLLVEVDAVSVAEVAPTLRPGREGLACEPGALEAVRDAAAGLEIWVLGPRLEPSGGAPGDGPTGRTVRRAGAADSDEAAAGLLVGPLDVPVARLGAARE